MTRSFLLLAAATLSLAACSDAAPEAAPDSEASSDGMGDMGDMADMTPAQQAYMRAMTEMHEAMGMPAADPDLAFMEGMREHHRGAIAMSEVMLQYGADEEAKALARQVIEEQTAELAEIDAWLAANASGASATAATTPTTGTNAAAPPPARATQVPRPAPTSRAVTEPLPDPSATPQGDGQMMDHSGMDHSGMDHSPT